MKTYLGIAIFCTVMCIIGIGMSISPLGGQEHYTSTGRLQMDSQQWEQFKAEVYKHKDASFDKIIYLDSGDIKLVSFDNLRVSSDFRYGTLTRHFDKVLNDLGFIEFMLVFVGSILGAICWTLFLSVRGK